MAGGDPALLAAAHQALQGTVGSFVWQEQRYVAKRLQAKPPLFLEAPLLTWCARRLAGQPLRPPALVADAAYERRRLQALAAAGQPVPPVLAWDETLMVLPHWGRDGFAVLKGLEQHQRLPFLRQRVEELARFHAAGHWHGGAQIKNLLLREDGSCWRIDFEEAALERLPLALAQAYDLVLFLNVLPLAGPIDEAESRALLPALLAAYFASHPAAPVRQCLSRMLPWARRLRALARPFRRLSRKSVRRAEILIDCLEAFLVPPHA